MLNFKRMFHWRNTVFWIVVISSRGVVCWNTTVPVPFPTVVGTRLPESPATTTKRMTTTSVPTTELPSFFSEFMPGSEYCRDLYQCNNSSYLHSFPDHKNCYCDEICNIFNDCCSDHNPSISWSLTASQFTCVNDEKIATTSGSSIGVYMVTACHNNWNNSLIQYLCESDEYADNPLLSIPVSDRDHRFISFKNMYCAQCNYVYNFAYWTLAFQCRDEARALCFETLEPWDSTYLRICRRDVISDCSLSENSELKSNCTEGIFSVAYDLRGNVFKNKYCAECQGLPYIFCTALGLPDDFATSTMPTIGTTELVFPTAPFIYTFRFLLDLNAAEDFNEGEKCGDSEIFDSFTETCRQIYCALPSVPVKGTCQSPLSTTVSVNTSGQLNDTCTLVKLKAGEYELRNNTRLYVNSLQEELGFESFKAVNGEIYVCIQNLQLCKNNCKRHNLFDYQESESYVSLIGMLVSVVSLSLSLIVYIAVPKLLNVPGKNLVCLMVCLLLGQLLFLFASQMENVDWLCKTVAVVLHYLYISAFCWMNVIGYDFSMTFSSSFVGSISNRNNAHRFKLYSIYGWLVPAVVVTVAVVIDLTEVRGNVAKFQPGYGNGICWITSSYALMAFVAGPLAVFKLFDIVAFVITVYFITKAKRQGARALKRKQACDFLIHLKLSLVLGLTWVFAFIANAIRLEIMWYLFIVFNFLQGLFITVSFVFTKRNWKLFKEHRERVTVRGQPQKSSSTVDTKL